MRGRHSFLYSLYTGGALFYYLCMQRTYTSLLCSLYGEQQFSIRDPLWKDIHLPLSFKPIIADAVFQKLGRIKQLGPTFHLYPGAVHTRLDHSLGVYHVGFSILTSLLKQANSGNLVLPCTEEGMKTFLCACLLHDIGHFPFAHSLKELPLSSHEAIANRLICGNESLRQAIEQAGIQSEKVGLIIDEQIPCDDEEIKLYRTILSGTLDPDKLDYLNRDAFFCGVPYGTQDVSYITDQLTVVDSKLAVTEQAIGSIEHLLFSKYLMYRNVYWHKTTRSATAMIKKAVLLSLADGSLSFDDLYGLDDQQFFMLPSLKKFPNAPLFAAVRDNRLYRLGFEKPYEAQGVLEAQTGEVADRTAFESALASRLGVPESQVIVDIPEPISFESDIPILGEGGTLKRFWDFDQIFSYDIGKVFTKSLRKFRIFTPSCIAQKAILEALEL